MSDEKIKEVNPDGGQDRTEDTEEEISFEERFKQTVEKARPYVLRLWAARKKLLYINTAVVLISILILFLLIKNYYRSTITILPDYGNKETMLSQFSGLASLAGVNLGQNTPTQIYQKLVTSEAILKPVIYAKYKTEKFPHPVNLIQYFEIKPDNNLAPELQKRDMFLKELKKLISHRVATDVGRMTQILTITVTMPDAQLSADVVNNIAKSLENYVQTQRKSYASDQEKYIKKRLIQVKDSLNIAENKQTKFNEENRVINQSPQLQLEQDRLNRNVDILSSVYLELRKQLELAKIDEINDTPIVNVQEYAGNPVIKAGPKRITILIFLFILSILFSSLYIAFESRIKKYLSYLKKTQTTN